MANDKTTTRLDIQVLRGLAVGLVVLYHAKLLPIPGGYLGVDIFFVISGFLITGLVRRSMEAGRFSFTEFYFRRAKRLLPAAYCTFLFTAILGLALLNAKEIAALGWQLLGSVTYTANFVLWQQAGYFAGPSELKPLLHIWSLSVEEQYYLVLPLAMWLAGRRRWLALMLGLLGLSALACVVGMHYKPVATFFMLPTRAWELCIGSVGALLASRTGAPAGCEIDHTAYRDARADVLRLVQRLSDEADVPVVGLEQALCDGQRCRTLLDGTILYVDSGHLTYEGSRLLARRHGLYERLMAAAR